MSQNYGDPKTWHMVTLMDNAVEVAGPVTIDWVVDVSVTNDVGVNVLNTVKIETVDGPLDVNIANIDAPIDIATMPDVTVVSLPDVTVANTVSVEQLAGTKFNVGGAEWTRTADIPSGAIATTTTSASIDPRSDTVAATGYAFVVVVTAVSGTLPTLDIAIQESVDEGTNWRTVHNFERIIANGSYTTPVMRASYGTAYRYIETVGGTGVSFTRSISRIAMSGNTAVHRQFIDRTINPTLVGSTTPVTGIYQNGYDIDGCLNHQVIVSRLAGGANIGIAMDGSLNGQDWYAMSGTLTVGASTTGTLAVTWLAKFARLRVVNSSATAVLNYACIKSLWLS